MSAARFVIEGEWSGYTAGQRKVVHRTVHAASSRSLRAWAEKAGTITYSDGTYTRLIEDCAMHDVTSVAALKARQS